MVIESSGDEYQMDDEYQMVDYTSFNQISLDSTPSDNISNDNISSTQWERKLAWYRDTLKQLQHTLDAVDQM